MNSAQWFLRGTGLVYLVSVLATIAFTNVEWAHVVPFLLWNHPAVIAVCGVAAYRLKEMKSKAAPSARALVPARPIPQCRCSTCPEDLPSS